MEREYVGIDLHRRRSVIVRKNAAGELLSKTHIDNDPIALATAVAAADPEPEVVVEATFGWYWAVDLLRDMGAHVHLAHPLGNDWGKRRVKNDERDANDLVDLLRLGRLAEAWIAPPELRELRELREMVRYRHKLMRLRSALKAQVHAVMGKHGVLPARVDMFGPGGTAQLDALELPAGYACRLESLRRLIGIYTTEITGLDRMIASRLDGHAGYRAVQALHGVGPVLAAVFVAEIGDISRFDSPHRLCSWAGMTPTHRESDTKIRRGSITKQGSRLLRWAAVEAVSKNHGHDKIKNDYRRIAERRGRNIARVAAARKLLTLVYYGLRDGEIRCLATQPRQGDARTQPADRLVYRHDLRGRQYVIEHCWLRRTAPCSAPTLLGTGEDMSKQPSPVCLPPTPRGELETTAQRVFDDATAKP